MKCDQTVFEKLNGNTLILKPGSKVLADGTEYQSVHLYPKLRVLDSQTSSLE